MDLLTFLCMHFMSSTRQRRIWKLHALASFLVLISCPWLPGMQLLSLITSTLVIETRQLPAPTFSIFHLEQNFAQRGLSIEDLVALSGGHTLRFSHCSSFQNRIHNFNATLDVDPTMQPSFTARLRRVCPAHNKVKNAGSPLDSTKFVFDNTYYMLLLQGKSIFSLDQALLTSPNTKALVSKLASSETAFVNSMIKMSSLNSGQEMRLDCRVVR
ncbi:Peroxidase 64 [Hibiscus syriacus]|uniref:peroxidase n=1 Tax=Hibiscus syriacus TaxID=106335 RepID=A0A6A3CNV1_HIBSY|nr:Peroxidase 64 [Hibiscus syriacus]